MARHIRTRKNRDAFLRIIAEGASVRAACQAIGIARAAAYEWREADPLFKADWDHAYNDGTDLFEDALRAAAAQSNITAIMFALRSRRPEVYARKEDGSQSEFPAGGHNALIKIETDGNPQIYIPATEELEPPTIEGEAEEDQAA
jgi:hypothetical protein